MYLPKGWHWAGPASLVLAGFYIRHNFGAHWDVHLLVQLPLSLIAAEWGAYIWQAGTAYQNFLTRGGVAPVETKEIIDWNTGKLVESKPTPKADGFSPFIRVDGKPMVSLNQVTTTPRMDKVRYVAFTLIRQRDNGFKVDLTENRWVKNWKFSREEFLSDVIDPWKHHGAIARAGDRKNAPYDVIRWDVIQLYAQGEKLPSPA